MPIRVDLSGVRILLVEDAWHLGNALKDLLQSYGAEVAGPVATSADVQRLASEQPPDAALVDFTLRNGERADVLIDRQNDLLRRGERFRAGLADRRHADLDHGQQDAAGQRSQGLHRLA
jgi:CheY-like chemotaxis protein